MFVVNRAAYEEPSWFKQPHPDAELSRADIDDATEAEIIFALDDADDCLTRAIDRLEGLNIYWESKADLRAELARTAAYLHQALDALDPQRRDPEGA